MTDSDQILLSFVGWANRNGVPSGSELAELVRDARFLLTEHDVRFSKSEKKSESERAHATQEVKK